MNWCAKDYKKCLGSVINVGLAITLHEPSSYKKILSSLKGKEKTMRLLLFVLLLVTVLITAGCVSENNSAVVTPTQTTTPSLTIPTTVQTTMPQIITSPPNNRTGMTEEEFAEFKKLMPAACNLSVMSGGDKINIENYAIMCVLEGQRREVSDPSLPTYTPSKKDDEFFTNEIRKMCSNAQLLEKVAEEQMGMAGYAKNPYSLFATITREYIKCLDSVDGTPDSCQHILFSERTRSVLSTPIAFEYSDSMKKMGYK